MNADDFVLMAIRHELEVARKNYEPIASLHEGYAVILEELDESWEEIKQRHPDHAKVSRELIQTAAMVVRTLADVLGDGGRNGWLD